MSPTTSRRQSDRLVIIVVDDLHIYKERSDRAKEIARQVLADLGPAASMAVLFTSGEHSTPVTDDRVLLAAAVETLRGRQSWRRPHPAIDAQRASRLDPEMTSEQQLAIISKTQDTKVQDFFDNMTQYKTLQDAARMLAGGEARRKAFVLISEGIGKELSGSVRRDGAVGAAAGRRRGLCRGRPRRADGRRRRQTYHDFALDRHDGVDAAIERRHVCDRSARPGRVEGPRA